MHPFDIQSELKKVGVTQKSIAEHFEVSEMTVSLVINKKISLGPGGQSRSKQIMTYIAEALDRHPIEVFPEYSRLFLPPQEEQKRKTA